MGFRAGSSAAGKKNSDLTTSRGDPGKAFSVMRTMIAYAFLQHRRLATARRKKRINGPTPQPNLPAVRHDIVELFGRLPPLQCPHCRNWICNERRGEVCQSSANSYSPLPRRDVIFRGNHFKLTKDIQIAARYQPLFGYWMDDEHRA
jgi:hypothetical protein